MPGAEEAYIFRHALVREGAYQLLLPEQRAGLHALAIEALEHLVPDDARDAFALELADHAALAQVSRRTGNLERQRALAAVEVRYLHRAADYAQAQYRMAEAIRLWDRLATHPALEAPARLHARTRGAVARGNCGNLPQAEKLMREALATGGEAGLMARLHAGLGVVLYNMAHVAEAAEQYRLALPALEAEGPSEFLARTQMNLGAAEEMLGEDGAEGCYHQAAETARRAGDRSLERAIIGNLGNLHHRRGRWPEAECEYLRSLELAENARDLRQVSAICVAMGIGLHEQGDAAGAGAYLRRAVEAARASQDRYKLGDALVNLAIIEGHAGNRTETLRLHDEALEIHRETGNVWGEATALIGRSDLSVAQGRLDDAYADLRRARELAAAVGDTDREGIALLRLALVDVQAGRENSAQVLWRQGRALLADSRMHRDSLHADMLEVCAARGIPPLKDDRP